MTKMLCLRCKVSMEFLKEQSIGEKSAITAFDNIGELFTQSENCKWYVCPKCRMTHSHTINCGVSQTDRGRNG